MKAGMTGRCGGCKAEWGGTAQCHCGACHEMFGSAYSFDRHRVDFACVPVAEFGLPMRNGKPRLVRAERRNGAVWVSALREGLEGAETASTHRSGQSELALEPA